MMFICFCYKSAHYFRWLSCTIWLIHHCDLALKCGEQRGYGAPLLSSSYIPDPTGLPTVLYPYDPYCTLLRVCFSA